MYILVKELTTLPVNQGDGTHLVQPQPTPTPVPPQPQQPPTSTTINFSSNKNNVLLQTATANVSNLTSNPISEDVQIILIVEVRGSMLVIPFENV